MSMCALIILMPAPRSFNESRALSTLFFRLLGPISKNENAAVTLVMTSLTNVKVFRTQNVTQRVNFTS